MARQRIPGTKKSIAIVSTGGTIEKTYDEFSGVLENRVSVLDVMLASLQLEGVHISRTQLMNKDSLEMTDSDHAVISATALQLARVNDGVVIVHGTDRLAVTGETLVSDAAGAAGPADSSDAGSAGPPAPIVLVGAMKPYELRTTDALQNLTEALLAVQLLPNGVYVAMHNKVLQFPGVAKDHDHGTFVRSQ